MCFRVLTDSPKIFIEETKKSRILYGDPKLLRGFQKMLKTAIFTLYIDFGIV